MDNDLERHYKGLQGRYDLEVDPSYASLVVSGDAAAAPRHRWFRFKEGYSPRLFERVVTTLGLEDRRRLAVLDPFSGSGTTVLSALEWAGQHGRTVVAEAVETNPFLHFVSGTKISAALEPPAGMQKFAEWLAFRLRTDVRPAPPPPDLSTFSREKYFPAATLDELLRIRRLIDEAAVDERSRALAKLALAASVEAASMLRRDGRALRFVPDKYTRRPLDLVTERMRLIMEDLVSVPVAGRATVHRGDGRRLTGVSLDRRFDLALFSPPYPNNIDYTEVYKLEGWFLGFYEDQDAFRAQRLSTLRSHPSIVFSDEPYHTETPWAAEFRDLVEPVLAAVPPDRYEQQRRRMVEGYCDDMLRTLAGVRARLQEQGRVVVVVGNSLHGGSGSPFLVASDLLIARLAELVGFKVDRIVEARRPGRRGKDEPFLRESLVVARAAKTAR